MLTTHYIRYHIDQVKDGLRKRNFSEAALGQIDEILALDEQRRAVQTSLDGKLHELNLLSKSIGDLYKAGKREEADTAKSRVSEIKEESSKEEEQMKQLKHSLDELLLSIPNVPHISVKKGKAAEDNEVVKAFTDKLPQLGEDAKSHWELAEQYNLIDFVLGAKITGSGFPLYRGQGAKLQRALINFFLDEATEAGYEEIIPPLLVNEDSARGTGQLPDKEGQMYHATVDNLYLIPTAEVPITNIYRDVIVDEADFPIKMTGHTPCFRREAGSYGSDVKGLNRVHQFDKIEIVQIQHPDKSYETLDEMVLHVEGLLQKLELPYRILRLCGGDMGFTSALTYDFEVFSAAQQKWLEVSSVSNFETFQSNRLKLRYKDEDGKSQLAHTLNGSALALARIVAALLENNQKSDCIVIPEVLRKYTKFDSIR